MAELSGSALIMYRRPSVQIEICARRAPEPRHVNVHVDYDDDGDEATNFIEISTARASASFLSYIEVK